MKFKSPKITVSLLAMVLSANLCYSQEIEWSDLQKMEGRATDIYPISGNDFYTISYSGLLGGKKEMQYHDDFVVESNEKFEVKVDKSQAAYQYPKIIDKKLFVFLSDHRDGVNTLYYQEYGTNCLPIEEPKELVSYTFPTSWKKGGNFSILQSDNKEYFSVGYEVPHSDTENERYGYKVFNKSFELISEGEYESPYQSKESSFTFSKLSNYGDLYFGMKVYNLNEKGKIDDFVHLKEYDVFLVRGNEVLQSTINLGDRFVSDLSFTADKNHLLTCTGLYGSKLSAIGGAFYFQLDFDKGEQLNEGFFEFSKEFITQDWRDRAKEKAEKKEAKGKGAPQLYSYDFRDVRTLDDGGLVALIEQYYVVVHTTRDPKTGATTTTYHYYYNDVIAYRVNADGKFDWVNKIDKSQHSVNDGGYCSSIGGYQKDNTYTLFFNDNIKNYDETGDFVGNPKNKGLAYSSTLSMKKNAVAKVELDLSSGEISRKSFTTRKEAESIAVPKVFEVDYSNNEMFLYFRTRTKEKFGLLKF